MIFSYFGNYTWYVYLDDISIAPASPWIEVTDITSTNSTLSGLSLNTEYQAQVKSDCADDEWSNLVSFTPDCTYPVPYTWDFDEYEQATLPPCWTRMGTSSSKPMVNLYNTHSGGRALEYYNTDSPTDATLIAVMPAYAADLNTLSVEFYGKQPYGNEPAWIEVGYVTDLNNASPFVHTKTFYMTGTYEKYTAFFNNAPAEGYIAFKTTYFNQNFAIVIDDVTVKEIECEAVTNLQVTETGATYLTLDWEGQDDADFYIFYTNLTTEERMYTVAAQPPFTLEGLTNNTTYSIEVTAECNVANYNIVDPNLAESNYFSTSISASNISLSAGWNWWAPMEQVTAAQLNEALNGHLQRIVSKTAEISLTSTADNLVPGQMYKLQTDADVMGNVNGTAVPVSITIGNGANWMGYTGETGDIDAALNTLLGDNFQPQVGDKIVSQDGGFAIYVAGSGWQGTLAELVKGQGYLYIR